MKITLIRHGKTAGNLMRRYIGITDEKLCAEGRAELAACKVDKLVKKVYSSPMQRTIETAAILYPKAEIVTVDELREMNFGIFENKNCAELDTCKEYSDWVSGGCLASCPGGENREEFSQRCIKAFAHIVDEEIKTSSHIYFMIHGGTIMAICSWFAIPRRDYYDWAIANGDRVELITDEVLWSQKEVRWKE